jgi:ankyrin repeat protein
MDQTNKHRTPLHQAVMKQQLRSLVELLDLGADLEALDQAGLTALDQAALDGDQAIAQLLIERGAVVRLPAAVSLNRVEDIERLLRNEPDALKPGQRFGTLIVRAARHSAGTVVEKLIQLGASVNVRDEQATAIDQTQGYTPLHAAAFHGNEDAVRVLLKHGADVNAREEKYGAAPAGWANYAGHRHIRDLILREPIDIFQAIEFEVTERIPQLLKTDREALQRRLRGYTPLASAAGRNNIEAARFLIGEGAELGLTPDQEARLADEAGYKAVLKLLDARAHPSDIVSIASDSDRVSIFVQAATWDHETHGKGDHRMYDRAAQRLLLQRPEMARHSLYTAIVCGDLAQVLRIVADDPAAATQRGGPRDWTPLLYLCYTRFSYPPAVENAVTIATALLDHGANPNDHYMAGHARYSALVGVAREGEQDAPPHPRRDELFKLLLDRGARMYDIQVLYNTHFSGDVLWWLKLVHAHAMAMGRQVDWNDPDWAMFDMGGYGSGARFLLSIAIRKQDVVLARWLLEHGANPNATPLQARGLSKRSLYEEAQREGATEIAELLRRFGAAVTPTVTEEGEDQFVGACLRLDRSLAQRLLAAHPEYLTSPVAMFEAATRDRADALELLVGLGASVDVRDSHNTRPLHHAAAANALAAAQFLVDRGAEIDPRERRYDAAPIGWAAHGDHHRMVDLLSRYSRNIWTLSSQGYVDRVRQILSDDPSLAKSTSADGVTPLWWLPDDEDKALEIVDLLMAQGADPAARSKRGTTAADWAEKRGMTQVVTRLKEANPRFRPTSAGHDV